jgi:hypothetical protein
MLHRASIALSGNKFRALSAKPENREYSGKRFPIGGATLPRSRDLFVDTHASRFVSMRNYAFRVLELGHLASPRVAVPSARLPRGHSYALNPAICATRLIRPDCHGRAFSLFSRFASWLRLQRNTCRRNAQRELSPSGERFKKGNISLSAITERA